MDCEHRQALDPRVKRTRKLLQDALRSLLHEKRFGEISVLDIAERSTINRATFYAHFEDKQALLESVLKRDFEEAVRSQFGGYVAFTQENVSIAAIAVYEFMARLRGQCPEATKDLNPHIGPVIQECLYGFIYCWAERDAPITAFRGYSMKALATAASWTIYGGANEWSSGDRKMTAEAHARELVALLFRSAA